MKMIEIVQYILSRLSIYDPWVHDSYICPKYYLIWIDGLSFDDQYGDRLGIVVEKERIQ